MPALTVGAFAERLIVAAGTEIDAPEAAWMVGAAAESAMVAEGTATRFPLATAGENAASVIVAAGTATDLPVLTAGAVAATVIVAAGQVIVAPVAVWMLGAKPARLIVAAGTAMALPALIVGAVAATVIVAAGDVTVAPAAALCPSSGEKRNERPLSGFAAACCANSADPGVLTRSMSVSDQRGAVGVGVVSGEADAPFPGEVAFDALQIAKGQNAANDCVLVLLA